jgi:hypothetical protein
LIQASDLNFAWNYASPYNFTLNMTY